VEVTSWSLSKFKTKYKSFMTSVGWLESTQAKYCASEFISLLPMILCALPVILVKGGTQTEGV
jgi:hypothetical protein